MISHLSAMLFLAALIAQSAPASGSVQPPDTPATLQLGDIEDRLRRDGRVTLERIGVILERADFEHEGRRAEAVIARPLGEGRRAGLLLVPGHSRTAFDMVPQAIRFARAGFATMSVSQPGYGGSTGPADFAGPRTFSALRAASERLAALPFVDPARLGVYGYSRGALVAAQLAARTDLFRAAVLGGGIYDFRSAYEQIAMPGIRANMEAEAGLGAQAVRFRSPICDLEGLDGPVLIIHGERDENAPPAQARALAERLTALGREHRLVIVPGGTHALGMSDVIVPAAEFFTRHLQPGGRPN